MAVADTTQQKLVTLTIDNHEISVAPGTLVVDAAKRAGIDIPVFCYHPKMEPVGMCRMCLVEVGRPVIDRATGQVAIGEDGQPQVQFGPKLETGCTVPVSEGMVVRGYTEKVKEARDEVLEFLLTSHPLDCPICDKGGECPLQNLTMKFGPGQTRFIYDEKIRLDKHVPLGDLIFLDRERCIQCARCTRFQSEIADDPVIGFNERGRKLEIVTFSDPGFDSYWSGNTTDICPVGALTTADFRFGARPWELKSVASICTHCPVNCNTTLNTRREAKSGGQPVVKRIMPRQNELVNEIWLCDKGRFVYQYTEEANRITRALVRKNNQLETVGWEEALSTVAEKVKKSGGKLTTVVSGGLTNEDYFNLKAFTEAAKGQIALYSHMAGGDLVSQVGLSQSSNLGELGKGDVIVVVASDLEEEAPVWWLRVKQAAERGAKLIVASPRRTKLEREATHVVRYAYGEEAAAVHALIDSISPKRPEQTDAVKRLMTQEEIKAAAKDIAEAQNLVVFYGSDGTDLAASESLSAAAANLLIATGHVGKPNNGLVAVWDKSNVQGAWELGLRPSGDLAALMKDAEVLYLVGVDPSGDDPQLAAAVDAAKFVVVQELAETKTTQAADVVLPAQAFTEREGTLTSGERRVQRYYPAVPAAGEARADFAIAAHLGNLLGANLEAASAGRVFAQLSEANEAYKGLTLEQLAEVTEQWPIIGRADVYYGGTTYDNKSGLGVQMTTAAERGETPVLSFAPPLEREQADGLLAVPVTTLFDRGNMISKSTLLQNRLQKPQVTLSPDDAERLGLEHGQSTKVTVNGVQAAVVAYVDNSVPRGTVLIPRSLGLPISGPYTLKVEA